MRLIKHPKKSPLCKDPSDLEGALSERVRRIVTVALQPNRRSVTGPAGDGFPISIRLPTRVHQIVVYRTVNADHLRDRDQRVRQAAPDTLYSVSSASLAGLRPFSPAVIFNRTSASEYWYVHSCNTCLTSPVVCCSV